MIVEACVAIFHGMRGLLRAIRFYGVERLLVGVLRRLLSEVGVADVFRRRSELVRESEKLSSSAYVQRLFA